MILNTFNFQRSIKIILVITLFSSVLIGCKKNTNSNQDINSSVKIEEVKPLPKNPLKSRNFPLTTVEFENEVYDYGTIEQGEKITHIFNFKNTGKNNLIIYDAYSSCGCTIPEYPKNEIKPGEKASIKVIFNSAGRSNKQDKTINIIFNIEEKIKQLSIKGFVNAKKK